MLNKKVNIFNVLKYKYISYLEQVRRLTEEFYKKI